MGIHIMPNEQSTPITTVTEAGQNTLSTGKEGIGLRAFQQQDLELLYQLYASVRANEMALMTEWHEIQKEAFLRFQQKAQHRQFTQEYPQASYDIICYQGEGIGRLFVDRQGTDIHLLDITLLPAYRRRGIATALLTALIHEAIDNNKIITLQLEADNPAKPLCLRLGFTLAGEVSYYQILHWRPDNLQCINKT